MRTYARAQIYYKNYTCTHARVHIDQSNRTTLSARRLQLSWIIIERERGCKITAHLPAFCFARERERGRWLQVYTKLLDPDEFCCQKPTVILSLSPSLAEKLLLVLAVATVPSLALYDSSDDVFELTASNFDSMVINSHYVWVVEFYAPW